MCTCMFKYEAQSCHYVIHFIVTIDTKYDFRDFVLAYTYTCK